MCFSTLKQIMCAVCIRKLQKVSKAAFLVFFTLSFQRSTM